MCSTMYCIFVLLAVYSLLTSTAANLFANASTMNFYFLLRIKKEKEKGTLVTVSVKISNYGGPPGIKRLPLLGKTATYSIESYPATRHSPQRGGAFIG